MKPSIFILVLVYLSTHSKGQDSLYAAKVDSLVRLTEDRIINLGQHMFIRNIQFEDWYEEYIGDTVNKKLLRVKSFRYSCDTVPVFHRQPNEPFYIVSCGIQSYTFFYNDNILVKITDNTRKLNYHEKDNIFIADEPSGLRAVNAVSAEHDRIKNVWLYGNKYIYRFKELLKE